MITKEHVDDFFKKRGDVVMYGENGNYLIYNAVNAVNKLGYWDFIRHARPNHGFVGSINSKVDEIYQELESDGHSAATFAMTLRIVQALSNEYVHNQKTEDICAICLSDIHDDKAILDCNHTYHLTCIEKQAAYNSRCPLCNRDTV